MTAARSAAPAVDVGAGALLVVAATVVGIAADGVTGAEVAVCAVGWTLEAVSAADADVAADPLPAIEGDAALWFREQPVTSVARIATPATATAVLERLTSGPRRPSRCHCERS